MTCATKTYQPLSSPSAFLQFPGLKTLIVFIEAFQEALDMRRKAHRTAFLSDE